MTILPYDAPAAQSVLPDRKMGHAKAFIDRPLTSEPDEHLDTTLPSYTSPSPSSSSFPSSRPLPTARSSSFVAKPVLPPPSRTVSHGGDDDGSGGPTRDYRSQPLTASYKPSMMEAAKDRMPSIGGGGGKPPKPPVPVRHQTSTVQNVSFLFFLPLVAEEGRALMQQC